MKIKILTILLFLVTALSFQSNAQERTVIGTVTSIEDGLPIPSATVKVKEVSSAGTVTGVDGKFSLKVPADAKTLVFSYLGFTTKEVVITGNTVIVSLAVDPKVLSEVVVTGAYGTSQTTRASATNAQSVSGEKLNTVRSTDINNALAGKVAGVQVRSQSTAALGRNTQIRLRGGDGFGAGSGALYVVDGTILPSALDLNLDDVEDISVLQGPAAAAILGSQAANGAILITTKKGKAGEGSGLSVNLGTTFESIDRLIKWQDQYAGGNNANLRTYTYKATDPIEWKAFEGKGYPNYSDDSSWGPKMNGQEYIPWYAWYPGSKYSFKTASLTPQPDNIRDFYQTGITANNSIAYANATDKYNFRANYANQYTQGLIPTTYLKKNTFNLNASYSVTSKLTLNANINYVNTYIFGEINDGYGNNSSGNFNQWMHRDLDMGIMKELRALTIPGANGRPIYASWNHSDPASYNAASTKQFYAANYWYNPYTIQDLVSNQDSRDRLYGSIGLEYKFSSAFKISANYRKNQNTVWDEDRRFTGLADSGTQTGEKGAYSTSTSYSNRENYEMTANYVKKIKDFSINALAGIDFFSAKSKKNGARTENGLIIPDVFRVANSVDQPVITNDRSAERYRAGFAKGQFGYKNLLFVEGTIRNDWFSSLPSDNNNVLSKSIGGSFIFSDLINKNGAISWLSEAKLRASWGEIPQSLDAYSYPGFSYGIGAVQWNGNLLMNTPDQLVDPKITGAVAQAKEIGLDFKLFKRNVNLSATYWDNTESNFPRPVSVNGATGFNTILTNIGKITKKGLEFQVGGSPVRSENFTWNINATYANLLDHKIVEISDQYGINRILVTGGNVAFANLPQVYHEKGQQWGQMFGKGIARNADGVPIVDASGYYTAADRFFGSVEPKHTGGFQNSFTIMKMFDVAANIDWQIGGKFASLSEAFGSMSGLTEETAALNDKGINIRESVANGGGVRVVGVLANGTPSDKYVPALNYFTNLFNRRTIDMYVHDLSFVKLREISIAYRIPVQKLGISKTVRNASLAFIARSPLLIYSKTKNFDPSEISGSAGETGQFPGTRGFGFNLKVGF